jgi:hypothetical protein
MDNFFYNLNKKMADLAQRQDLAESAQPVAERSTGDYSAKKAAAGKDIGKPGKMFSKIAKSAGNEYGSKAAGERVAGAVLNKLRKGMHEGEYTYIKDKYQNVTANGRVVGTTADGGKTFISSRPNEFKSGAMPQGAMVDKQIRTISSTDRQYPMGMMEGHCSACDCAPCQCNEGNAFSKAVVDAKRDGIQKGEKIRVGGKQYPVKEADPMGVEEGAFKTQDIERQEQKRKIAPPQRNQDAMAGKQDLKQPGKEHPLTNVPDGFIKFLRNEPEPMGEEKTKEPRSKGTAFDPDYQAQAKKEKEGTGNFDKKKISTGTVYTRKHKDDEEDEVKSDQPKVKGRPKGPAKGPERVTAKSYKYKGGRPVKENDISMADQGEYDQEGDMAKEQLHTIKLAARELASILSDNENLPEWVQSKITKAMDYIDTARDYMIATKADRETMAERSARPVQKPAKGRKPDFLDMAGGGDKKEPMKKAVADKKEKKVSETTTSGSVATAPETKKSSGSMQFGKGVYEGAIAESYEKKLNTVLAEAMNVTVTMNNQDDGNPTKTINVSADGEDAEKLAEILKLAGLGGQSGGCSSCGQAPCGCQTMDEAYGDTTATMNSPDYPTDTETIGGNDPYLRRFSGGPNDPKDTKQGTLTGGGLPTISPRRQVSMEENVKLERSLFNTWKTYKGQ